MLGDGNGVPASRAGALWPVFRNLMILAAVGAMAAWALSFRSEVSQALRESLPDARAPAASEAASSAPSSSLAGDEAYGSALEGDEAGAAADAAIDREIVIRKAAGGHFLVDAMVNGVAIRFLVDTGASDVVLSPDDARRLHIAGSGLDYSLQYETANGVVRAAPVTLRDIRIGQLELYDLEATVNEAPMSISLLGMAFLERLEGYSVEGDRLVLLW